MPKGKIGFEQLNENLKQKIELGGSGGGGGVGFLKNTVVVTTSTNTVKIGLQFEPGTDALLVFKNSTYQELEHDYTIDDTGKYIKTTSGQWIASNEAPVTFNFIVLRTVPLANSIASNTGAVGFIRKTILVEQDTNEIELDLMYNKVTDAILVFRNSVLIEAEEDYTIDMDRQVLINPNANWVAGTLLNLMVFKSVPVEDVKFDGEIIEDGTISIDKLSPEFNVLINNLVQDFETSMVQINQDIKNLENTMNNTINNSMANMQVQINDIEALLASKQNKTDNSLRTSNKNIVGAINEVFQYANDGKSSIASAIVGKGGNANTAMTFAQLATAIKNLPTKRDAYADLSALFRFDDTTTKSEIDYVLNRCSINVWDKINAKQSVSYYSGVSVLTRNRYYSIGGESKKYTSSSVVYYFNIPTESWGYATNLPIAMSKTCVAKTSNGNFFLGKIGANSKGDYTYDNPCYKWNANDTYSSIAKIPAIYHYPGLCEGDGKLYVTGGYRVRFTSSNTYYYYQQTVFAYDYTLGTWTTIIKEAEQCDDRNNYIDREPHGYYYQNNYLYDKNGNSRVDLQNKKFIKDSDAGFHRINIPGNYVTISDRRMIDDNNNKYYTSGKNAYTQNVATGMTTKHSKFSGSRPAEQGSFHAFFGGGSALYCIMEDKEDNNYVYPWKIDLNFDNFLAQ